MPPLLRKLCVVIAAVLGLSTALFAAWSWRWPLVGDAALIHYIGFLIERGWVPYRQLGDMNMPGSFLIEMGAMRVFGGGALGWRLFDFSLLAVAGGAFFVVTRKAGWFAGAFATGLFALVHGRDGLAEGGQRDLTMAVLLIASTAAMFTAVRRRNLWWMAGFGLLAGVALTIKPTALPLSLAQLGIAVYAARPGRARLGQGLERVEEWGPGTVAWFGGGALLVGPLAAVGWLAKEQAIGAFLAGLHGLVPYYASLGHRPLGFLLLHSVSPLLPLVVAWLAVLLLFRPMWDWERAALGCGVLFGLLSYVVQARGLPYYRYPLLAFLLPLMAIHLAKGMRLVTNRGLRLRVAGWISVGALGFGGLFLGPQSAVLVHRYRWWETDFITSLEGNLQRLGGAGLSGHIQCVDSISGCGAALYGMRLEPASGVLSDFLLFGPDGRAIVETTRAEFRTAVMERPPRVIVVSSWLHMEGPGEYRKLQKWPELADFLARNYTLDTEWAPNRMTRWWSREELPAGYRIYVLR